MNIYEALEKLDSFFDALANYGECSEEELDIMGEIEDTIYQFARKYEPMPGELPLEHTCDCGTHMVRNRVTEDGDAEFICSGCNSIWLLGRPF